MAQQEIPEIDLAEENRTALVRGVEDGSFKCNLTQLVTGNENPRQQMFKEDTAAAKKIDASILEEAKRLFRLKHAHLAQLLAVGFINDSRYLITALCPWTLEGEMAKARDRSPPAYLNPLVVTDWIIEITDAMSFLHDNDTPHGNIKPNNILIDWENKARVADFALPGKKVRYYI
ncbi:hypothetical protein PFISCL1PPCAC_13428, partial [Pristionchus fissidentatus]